MSKLQFFEMRAEQMIALYDSTFTKKDAIKTGENLIDSVLESADGKHCRRSMPRGSMCITQAPQGYTRCRQTGTA